MKKIATKTKEKFVIFLSHRPKLYALIVGVGIVLFWRGVWHSTDLIHEYFTVYHSSNISIDAMSSPWWDGLLSLLLGSLILYFTGSFVSSFIGNELILSGLRGEKRLNQKTESEVKSEVQTISDIKKDLENIKSEIEQLEQTAILNDK